MLGNYGVFVVDFLIVENTGRFPEYVFLDASFQDVPAVEPLFFNETANEYDFVPLPRQYRFSAHMPAICYRIPFPRVMSASRFAYLLILFIASVFALPVQRRLCNRLIKSISSRILDKTGGDHRILFDDFFIGLLRT